MAKGLTIQQFFKRFPDDETCLEHLMMLRFGNLLYCPKCGAEGQFAKLKKVPAYACPTCGHHIHPMVGTPFERSRTSLQKWFYAMYLFTTTRHGVPARELQRQLGVTLKCAWRMGHEIRKYMGEVDGELYTKVVPNASGKSLIPEIIRQVPRGTRISSDEWAPYKVLTSLGYRHDTVDHRAKEYARGDVHVNSLESFWSILKRSIRGTHVHVSRKHLPKYLGEFEFRYNMRKSPEFMFEKLLLSF